MKLSHFSLSILISAIVISSASARTVSITEYKETHNLKGNISISCEDYNKSYHSFIPSFNKCTKVSITGVGICYKNCYCKSGYKTSTDGCTPKTCADYSDYPYDNCPKDRNCISEKKYLGGSKDVCYAIQGCPSGYKESSGGCSPKTCGDYGYSSSTCSASQEQTEYKVYLGSTLTRCYKCSSCTDGQAINPDTGNCETITCQAPKTIKDGKCVCPNQYRYPCNNTAAHETGGVDEACDGKYTECTCATGYKWYGSSCEKTTCYDPYEWKNGCVCKSSYKHSCSGTGYKEGFGAVCNGRYESCLCSTGYHWDYVSETCTK